MSEPDGPADGPPGEAAGNALANIPLTIGGVSRLLGVAASTLRTWDRRYDLGPSERTDGQHRRYTRVDVARLALVRQLTLRGAPPAEAARAALATPASALTAHRGGAPGSGTGVDLPPVGVAGSPDGPGSDEAGADGPATDGPAMDGPVMDGPAMDGPVMDGPVMDRAGWPPRKGGHQRTDPQLTLVPELVEGLVGPGRAETPTGAPRRPSVGRVAPLRMGRVSALARGLGRAALAMDAPLMTEVLTDGVGRLGVVPTWDSVVSPVLVAVGRRWELTGDGIEIEHLLSETVLSVMSHRAASLASPPSNSRPVLLAATAAEMHVLSLYAISAAMAERRVSVRVLGARVPGRALAAAVARVVPSAVFLFAQSAATAHVDPADLLGSELTPGLVVGGPGWDPSALPAGALHAGSLARAVDLLCALAV